MSKQFKTIMVPTDFSEDSELAMQQALQLFGDNADRIILLTVYEGAQSRYTELSVGGEVDAMMDQSAHSGLESFKEKFQDSSQVIETVVKKGNPASKILEVAKEMDVDLIVMGSQGRNALARVFFGNTTYQVSRKAHCSIFVVRH